MPQLFANDFSLTSLVVEFGDIKAELIAAIALCAMERVLIWIKLGTLRLS